MANKSDKPTDEVILLVDDVSDTVYEAYDSKQLLEELREDYGDEEIIEELLNGDSWCAYRARRIELIPETQTTVNLISLIDEE
jgi:hypothetical protein